MDISRTALEIAKKKALQTKVGINFLQRSFIYLLIMGEELDFVFNMAISSTLKLKATPNSFQACIVSLEGGGVFKLNWFS
jgi:2-polyprenyl-3-methyl-5-hydroxy-6-metoxy-1,4-benzoquinol methylase